MKTYPKACEYCNATGFITRDAIRNTTSVLTEICPVCNGNKVIVVTETS